MTTLTELVTSVTNITNRPDLVLETQQSIYKATLKEHAAIDYPRDLVSLGPLALDNTSGLYRYSISLITNNLYPVMRKVDKVYEVPTAALQATFSSAGYYGAIQFDEIDPARLFDEYNLERYNYFYRQGNTLELVAFRQVDNIGIRYYARPTVTLAGYSSWIADMYDYVIYEAAAADVFKMIGKDEEAGTYRQKLQDNRLDIIRNEIGAI
jgi:hypothetical protein